MWFNAMIRAKPYQLLTFDYDNLIYNDILKKIVLSTNLYYLYPGIELICRLYVMQDEIDFIFLNRVKQVLHGCRQLVL